jgi:hypothetical protein
METSDENNETTQKGDDLSSFILPLGSKAGTLSSKTNALPSSSSLVDSEARDTERRHEIVALLPGGGETGWHLLLNYRNWNAIRGRIDEDAPTMVISFLGDTEVGKSHTIRELMSDGEERPFVQRGADQRASTTSNVNLFECRSLVPGVTVNLLDFEGENGSQATVVGGSGATSRKGSGSGGTASALGIGLAASAGVGGATGSSSLLSSALNRSSSRPPSASSSSSTSIPAAAPLPSKICASLLAPPTLPPSASVSLASRARTSPERCSASSGRRI